ncbi:MAG: ComEC/Rec2 family competence protein [Acutalibacteraceae bacterium]
MEKRRVKTGVKSTAFIIFLICCAAALIYGHSEPSFDRNPTTVHTVVNQPEGNRVTIHFLDVGQGNSTLIQCGNNGVLIDGGEKEYGDTVCNYLLSNGIENLDCVIATHPHSDHIGGLIDVLGRFPVDQIIMPALEEFNTPTTSTYETFLMAIKEKNIPVSAANPGEIYGFGDCSLEILGPLSQDEELNNMSVVCRLTAFSSTFLLLADAEKQELHEIEDSGATLSCNVLQAGHHGSNTSVLTSFLDSAAPDYVVISCGKNNKYGFPGDKIMEYLKEENIEYYRTDLLGSIIFTCTEDGLTVRTK